MSSDNPSGADDQQETKLARVELDPWWIEKDQLMLEGVEDHFGCGRITHKGPLSSVLTYSVWNRNDLEERVLPFFEAHPLAVKTTDFERLAEIVRKMNRKVHLRSEGFEELVRIAYSMNLNGKQRSRTLSEVLEGSSETARQAPKRVKVQSDPRGDTGS